MAQLPILLTIVLIISGSIWLEAGLTSQSPAVFFPNFIRFWMAAMTLGIVHGFRERSLPPISARLVSSSIVCGTLFMALPASLWLWSLRFLPASYIALCISTVLLWISAIMNRSNQNVRLTASVCTVGLALAGAAIAPHGRWEPLIACWLATLSMATAGILARQLYWIHSSTNLNLWSMIVASLVCFPLSLLTGETTLVQTWSGQYWLALFGLSLIGTAAGTLFYRRFAFRLSQPWLSACLIAPTLTLFSLRGPEAEPVAVAGYTLTLLGIIYLSREGKANRWMNHFLANSIRNGERLEIDMQGFIKLEKGDTGTVRITSISVGGLGFESELHCPVADRAVVTLPMGKNFSQVSFDTLCAYTAKNAAGGWTGGLAFVKFNLATTQIVAEFIARLAHAPASTEPAVEIRKESMVG